MVLKHHVHNFAIQHKYLALTFILCVVWALSALGVYLFELGMGDEAMEVLRVRSVSGARDTSVELSRQPPFRAPHHTVSYAGLVGGGSNLAPGEITLAHRGVLFLDELPEFRREVLEALRQPLESGTILISRAGRQVELPAAFQLVAAMNPCPCGYRGHPRVACPCPASAVQRYRRRISPPLLDRVELRLEVPAPSLEELAPGDGSPPTPSARELGLAVGRARTRQEERGQRTPNAGLDSARLDEVAPLRGAERDLMARAAEHRALSARAVQSLRRVARTLADLQGCDEIDASHLAEALALRGSLVA